ncbi:MAG TPA: HAMP domain-containing protein, partial [Myxococcaceae bacterium]|nr:HAMP domain-containing protein [Myxococcaceae bacterium]
MSIRVKLILAFAFLAVAGLATSLWASYQAVRAAALHRLEADVDRAVVDVRHKLQELRRVADLQVGSISGQSVYVDVLDNAYFADSDLGLVTYTAAEKAAKERERFDIAHEYILSADLLALRGRPETGDQRELLVLLNREGKVVYNDANPDEYLEPIQGVRIVEEALAGDTAVDLWSSDYVGRFKNPLGPTHPKDLYLVIAQPIFRNQTVIGVMLLGQRATTGLLPQMERGLRGARVVLQTAQDGSMASLVSEAAALTRSQRDGGGPGVDLNGLRYLVRAEDIRQDIAATTPPLGKVFVLLEVEGELRESLNVFWRWILPLSALTLLGAAVVTHVLSKRLAKPLQELEAAARKVGQGDLTVEVTAYGRDEVAKLAVSFNEMVLGLRQRDQIKGLFKRYLNPAVVDELIKHPEKASPGGERRQI